MSAEAVQVQSNRLADQLLNFLDAVPDDADSWQLRRVSAEACFASFDDDRISGHVFDPFRPACFRMFASVPDGTSAPGLPATVRYQAYWGGGTGGGYHVAAGVALRPLGAAVAAHGPS